MPFMVSSRARRSRGSLPPALSGRSGPVPPALSGRSGPVPPALSGRSGPVPPALSGRSGPGSSPERSRASNSTWRWQSGSSAAAPLGQGVAEVGVALEQVALPRKPEDLVHRAFVLGHDRVEQVVQGRVAPGSRRSGGRWPGRSWPASSRRWTRTCGRSATRGTSPAATVPSPASRAAARPEPRPNQPGHDLARLRPAEHPGDGPQVVDAAPRSPRRRAGRDPMLSPASSSTGVEAAEVVGRGPATSTSAR